MKNLEVLLEKHFGYTSFRPGQKEIIEQLLYGRDVVALLPTGMGKSLCYQLPGYIFQKPVLIVSPLLSLMQDQVDQLKQLKEKRVVALNSFLTFQQKQSALHQLEQYRFIFISPEMLVQPTIQQRLNQMELSLIVVDEAHCISQWGYDFRPDYLRIGEAIQHRNRPPILALSATATSKVLFDIKSYLKMRDPFTFVHSVDRPNLHLGKKLFHHREEKLDWIYAHVKETEGPGIIYTQSRNKTELLSQQLIQLGISVAAYHGGMDALDRQFIQQQFIEGALQWIVATNAFGMGVHKGDVRQIIHESLPTNLANYMQEIGRAGRDGEDAIAILLYAESDEEFTKFVGMEDYPTDAHVDEYQNRINRGELPITLLQQGIVTETAFRVLDYWMKQLPPQEVKHQISRMKNDKLSAVDEVMQLIHSQHCMRKIIVEYFGQKLESKQVNCCETCGLEYGEIINRRRISNEEIESYTWQDRITKILLGNSF